MGKQTNIAWTESTLNLAWGCTKVSEECRNCYMYRMSPGFGRDPTKVEFTKAGRIADIMRHKIRENSSPMFVNSMSDTFHKDIPITVLDAWFSIFEEFPDKQFQILTKRPETALRYFGTRKVPPNCWIGTSVGIESAKHRIATLSRIDARIRFISFEPLLEDLGELDLYSIHWAIIGGESGAEGVPREMKAEWAESIIKQCRQQGVKPFFKQMGGVGGDNAGGNLLNGKFIQEMPSA